MGGHLVGGSRWRPPTKEARAAPRELEPVVVVFADSPQSRGNTRVVSLTAAEYQRAVRVLGQRFQVKGTAQETAQGRLQAMPEEELLAEVYRDRVLTLVPLNDKGPLVPEANRAHEATTFEELREAGEAFGQVIGTDAARALILAVATLSGRTLGEVAAHVRSLPRFNQVQAQWAAQGMEGSVAVAMKEAAAVEEEVVVRRALVVLTSMRGGSPCLQSRIPLAVPMS